MRVTLITLPVLYTKFPSLALPILSGVLKNKGHLTQCLDLNIDIFKNAPQEFKKYWHLSNVPCWDDDKFFSDTLYPQLISPLIDKWIKQIRDFNTEVLCVSLVETTFPRIIIKEIKQRCPHLKIIAGGTPCSRAYAHKLWRVLPDRTIDATVSGEGEKILPELLNHMASNNYEIPLLPGVSIFKKAQVIEGDIEAPVHGLDDLPFCDFSDYDFKNYYEIDEHGRPLSSYGKEIPIFASRGCRGKCNFCIDCKIWPGKYRSKSAKRMAQEIKFYIENYKIKSFVFVDLMFNTDRTWITEFSKYCDQWELKFDYWCLIRVDKHLNNTSLKQLKNTGLLHINIGLESASSSLLKKMNKNIQVCDASRIIKDAYKCGITSSLSLICGFPGETLFDTLKTIFFVFRHRKYLSAKPSVNVCFVIPGSDLYTNHEMLGIDLGNFIKYQSSSWTSHHYGSNPHSRQKRKAFLDKIFLRLKFGS